MLKDLRHLAYLGLATTSLAGAVVAVAMTAMAASTICSRRMLPMSMRGDFIANLRERKGIPETAYTGARGEG